MMPASVGEEERAKRVTTTAINGSLISTQLFSLPQGLMKVNDRMTVMKDLEIPIHHSLGRRKKMIPCGLGQCMQQLRSVEKEKKLSTEKNLLLYSYSPSKTFGC